MSNFSFRETEPELQKSFDRAVGLLTRRRKGIPFDCVVENRFVLAGDANVQSQWCRSNQPTVAKSLSQVLPKTQQVRRTKKLLADLPSSP